ncbi:MAG: methyltransferase [Xanthomonadales bacterium]|nr:methyltransferase [Xanthomonadales bacterium]
MSQLLMRHAAQLADRRLLLVNPPVDRLLSELPATASGTLFDQRRSAYRERGVPDERFELRFGPWLVDSGFGAAVVFLPREKQLVRLLLRMSAACLKPGSVLWVIGENRAGAKSAGRLIAEVCPEWEKVDAARHCSLFRAVVDPVPKAIDPSDWVRSWSVDVSGMQLQLRSLPGVFSHGELDPATRMLLEHLPPLSGDVLDFGCGCGVIGLFAALRDEPRVHFSDDSALAIEATRLTLAANGLEPAGLVASDAFDEIDGPYDAILSNPPFHRGVGTHYEAAQELIECAPDFLRPGGQLVVVANAFLDYPRRIEQRFGECETLVKDRRFGVYLGRTP